MKKILVFILLAVVAWTGYEKYHEKVSRLDKKQELVFDLKTVTEDASVVAAKPVAHSDFVCDGRTYCSQMRSCDEAKYFLQHCPDVKMDGNHDGIPCEKQWCR